jgi:hypothetical protein
VLDTIIHKTKNKQNKNTTQYVLDTTIHKTKNKQNKNTTQYVLDTNMHKETQITQIRHEASYK